MLVSLRKRSLGSNLLVRWHTPSREVRNVLVDKHKLVSCLQMLHANENSMLVSTNDAFVQLSKAEDDSFLLEFGSVGNSGRWKVQEGKALISPQSINWLSPAQTPQDSMKELLFFAQRQLLPTYSKAVCVAERMQTSFGNISMWNCQSQGSRIDEAFMLNNASTISKLVDMLRGAMCDKKLPATHAGRLAWLAAMFCAAAPASKAFNLFNVTQLQMTTMSDYTTERMYEQAPEKQHITLLMRGGNAVDDRIRRFNVAVRIFPAESEFVKELMPQVVGLNASIFTPVMIVTGISNNQAAAIFLGSDSLRTHCHATAMRTFMCGL